ncbi:MAG: DNRLRE domain-containing protein [Planctomycetota bacterium]
MTTDIRCEPRLLLLAASIAAGLAAGLRAQTTVAIEADRDVTLYESTTGSLANGTGDRMFFGVTGQGLIRRGLVHFDVAANVPAGAKVLAATLVLTSVGSSSPPALAFDAHRVTQNWSEGPSIAPSGQGAGAPAQAGDATWLHANFPNQLWASGSGGSFVATPSFAGTIPANGPSTTLPLAGLVGDVQAWLDSPSSNFGWLLKGDESLTSTSTRVRSREGSTASERPQLQVTYVLAGQTGSYGLGTAASTGSGTVTLATTGSATGGTTLPLNYSGAPNSQLGSTFFTLELNAIGVQIATDRTVLLGGSGPLIPGALFSTDAGGLAASSFVVPAASPGFLIVAQGAILDGSALGFALSNAIVAATQ